MLILLPQDLASLARPFCSVIVKQFKNRAALRPMPFLKGSAGPSTAYRMFQFRHNPPEKTATFLRLPINGGETREDLRNVCGKYCTDIEREFTASMRARTPRQSSQFSGSAPSLVAHM